MNLDLLVFTADPARASTVLEAGAAGVIVDWENKGKPARQQGADTEINYFGPGDLRRVRMGARGHVICRINGPHSGTREEIDTAIDCGADELFLPMVRRLNDAENFIAWINGRAKASILIETLDAVLLAPELGQLPLNRIYAGLNDLAIDRRSHHLFAPVIDGLLDGLRPYIQVPFGFGGLTLPECGHPIPCRLLLGEISRLRCSFTFLRRSFWRDMEGRDPRVEIPRILSAVAAAGGRSGAEIEAGHQCFRRAFQALQPAAAAAASST